MKTDDLYNFVLKIGGDPKLKHLLRQSYSQDILHSVATRAELYSKLVEEFSSWRAAVAKLNGGPGCYKAEAMLSFARSLLLSLVCEPDIVPVEYKFRAFAQNVDFSTRVLRSTRPAGFDFQYLKLAWDRVWNSCEKELHAKRMSKDTRALLNEFIEIFNNTVVTSFCSDNSLTYLRKMLKDFLRLSRKGGDIMPYNYFYYYGPSEKFNDVTEDVIKAAGPNPFYAKQDEYI